MSEPIAIYRERLPQVGRVLELYSDRIVVRAKWLFGKSYKMTIPLSTLDAQPREIWTRQKLFKRALAVSLMAAALAVVPTLPGGWNAPQWVIYGLYGLSVLAGGVTVMAFPKVLFVRFKARDGKPGLDIFRAGPDMGAFQEFVEMVKKRIRKN